MKPVWYIKRKPLGRSFFRDGFPYLEALLPHGSLWVQTRAAATAFRTLGHARRALKLAKQFEDKAIRIVRVTPRDPKKDTVTRQIDTRPLARWISSARLDGVESSG